ncbi:MAG: isocitrate/isopropylmalate dehydrogenase family protein [Roseiflexaceae bacterium]
MSERTYNITVIPGDGIGREVIPAAVAALEATGRSFHYTYADAGWECFQRNGTALPDQTLAAAQAADAVLFGAVASPSFPVVGYRSPIVALRRALDLFANIRPVSGGRADLVVVRENTEGLYSGRERVSDDGNTAITERVITRQASERIVRLAFDLARTRAAKHVTIVHKANVLRETCGLFRKVALEVASEYPTIRYDEMLVDNCALQLIQRPERFDVVVTTNLFGDIISDVASYWGGGLGVAVSANIGTTRALFEPVHGAAPDIVGQGIANPLAAIGCAALLLEYLGEHAWAERVRNIVTEAISEGPQTPDLGGSATTAQVTAWVVDRIGRAN